MPTEPAAPGAESTTDPDAPTGTIDAHQPGHDDHASLGPRPTDGSTPPDAVADGDDKGGDPVDRAPKPPSGAKDTA